MVVKHADAHYVSIYTSYRTRYTTDSNKMHECIGMSVVVPRQVSHSPPQIAMN